MRTSKAEQGSLRVALTGATGFVGQSTLTGLLAAGHSVRALLRSGKALPEHDRLQAIQGDLADRQALEALLDGCDAVIHVAGSIAGRNYLDFAAVNVAGTRRLIEATRSADRPMRLIHVSSLAATRPQLSDYAASKRAGEELVTGSGTEWTIVRPPAVYGPADPALAPFWKLLARGWLLRLGPRQARFSLLHVEDLAALLVTLPTDRSSIDSVLEPDDGLEGGYDWPRVAEIAADRRGGRVRIIPVPRAALAMTAALVRAGSRLTGSAPVLNRGKVRELRHPRWLCDNTALKDYPWWRPLHKLESALATLPGWRNP